MIIVGLILNLYLEEFSLDERVFKLLKCNIINENNDITIQMGLHVVHAGMLG